MSFNPILAAAFWAAFVALVYTYAGYPLLLRLAERLGQARRRRSVAGRSPTDRHFQPSVAVALAAFNEEGGIERRLTELDRHESDHDPIVLIGSDGSSDATVPLARAHPSDRTVVVDFEQNRGRAMVHNDLVAGPAAEHEADIIIFSDVDTVFDDGFIDRLVAPFADPEVGCTVGRLVWANEDENGSTASMGIYWRMEMALRRSESNLGLLATGTGAAMAVRRSHWRPLQADEDVDFVTPLHVVADGGRVVMVPDAVAQDETPASGAGVLRARARMTSKNLIGTVRALADMGLAGHAVTWWSIISHKILRWLSGYLLLTMVATSGLLIANSLYLVAFLGQVGIYTLAAVGHLGHALGAGFVRPGPIDRIHSALLPIVGMTIGVTRALMGQRITSYAQRD